MTPEEENNNSSQPSASEVLHEQDAQPCMKSNLTFNDIKGVHEAKADLQDIVHYLQNPEGFTHRLGGKLPKGVLLIGPPGTGKTMLARAVAAEADVPFFSYSGNDLAETFVGSGPKRIRDIFSAAKKLSPCIIFVEALDSIGGTHSLKEPQDARIILNQLLIELDGLKQKEGIVVIAETNFVESLDKTLVRPRRFDHHVVISNPDNEARRQILEVHLSKVPRGGDVVLENIARQTPGFSGAELAYLVNSAALSAASEGAKEVKMSHLEYAKYKMIMQTGHRSTIMSDEARKLTAFHESGHAILAVHCGVLQLDRAAISLHGKSLGLVTHMPDKYDMSISRRQMLAWLDIFMGGRVAEELTFGEDEVTSGASSFLEQATSLAKAMITKYGMSNEIGPVFINYENDAEILNNDTRILIEREVGRLLKKAYKNAKKILMTHKKELDALAHALLEHETLKFSEIKTLLYCQVKSQYLS